MSPAQVDVVMADQGPGIADVEKAMANVSYRPGQQVTDAADA